MKLTEAFALATEIHEGAVKKGTTYPYLYHPLAVASLVLKHGGNEAQVQAALLHDTIADERLKPETIRQRFGVEVQRLAYAFEDPQVSPEVARDWQKLRQAYLDKLGTQSDDALLVVACEELHELGELLNDLRRAGAETWQRYPVPASAVYWYFRELLVLFHRRLTESRYQGVVTEFGSLVRKFKAGLFDGASF